MEATMNTGAREITSKLVPKRLREQYNLSLTDEPVNSQFNLKMTDLEAEDLKDRAARLGLTATAFIRLCIFAFSADK